MNKRLENKVALVTGGASGIGRAIATGFAEEGAKVTIADIREEPREGGLPTHELIKQNGGVAQFIKTDVSDVDSLSIAVEATTGEYGSLDIMVK